MANKLSQATSVTGVSKLLTKDKYRACISINNKSKYKEFRTFGEAVTQRLRWEREREEFKAKQKASTQPICTNNCLSCMYMKWFDCQLKIPHCDYYLMTGHRRPCKAGDNCTVKKPKPKDHTERLRKHYSDSFIHSATFARNRIIRVNRNLEYTDEEY